MDLFVQIDLTALGALVRQNPEVKKTVQFKDGSKHEFINASIAQRREPGKNGSTHYVKVYCKKDLVKQNVNYYIGDGKVSEQKGEYQQTQSAPVPQPQPEPSAPEVQTQQGEEELPF